MDQPSITFVLNGKTFTLRAGDSAAIGAIPAAERQHLLALLEAVKQQEDRAEAAARRAVDRIRMNSQGASGSARIDSGSAATGRLGSGDVDALMSRLVMEENRARKPALSRQLMYKWVLGCTLAIVLLAFMF